MDKLNKRRLGWSATWGQYNPRTRTTRLPTPPRMEQQPVAPYNPRRLTPHLPCNGSTPREPIGTWQNPYFPKTPDARRDGGRQLKPDPRTRHQTHIVMDTTMRNLSTSTCKQYMFPLPLTPQTLSRAFYDGRASCGTSKTNAPWPKQKKLFPRHARQPWHTSGKTFLGRGGICPQRGRGRFVLKLLLVSQLH